jgi:hypothetical protein
MAPAYKLPSVEEFLDACPNDKRHYQLIDGVIVAMAPPAIPHLLHFQYPAAEVLATISYLCPATVISDLTLIFKTLVVKCNQPLQVGVFAVRDPFDNASGKPALVEPFSDNTEYGAEHDANASPDYG